MNFKRTVLSLALCAAVIGGCVGTAAAAEIKPGSGNGGDTQPTTGGDIQPICILVNSYTVTVNGKSVDWRPIEKAGRVMVPLKRVGEALGFTVTWDETARAAKIANSEFVLLIYPNTDSYVRSSNSGKIVLSDPVSYGAACQILDGSMYVPVRVFELLGGTVTLSGHHVDVSMAAAQVPNPVVKYPTVADAAKAAGIAVMVQPEPAALKGIERVSVIGGTLLEIDYQGGICYRVGGKDAGDVSGDYTVYDSVKTVAESGLSVTLKADKTGVRLAIWNDGAHSFSLSWQTGVTQAAALALVASVPRQGRAAAPAASVA